VRVRRAGALLIAIVSGCNGEVRQPIAYNHSVHVRKLEMPCAHCHETSASGEVASLPPLSTCAQCHQEANGDSPAERMVVEAVGAGREIPWVRIYELPRHVYFTHRRHVTVARIACERCHGDMGSQSRPPPRPLVALTMDGCLGCHREQGASLECDGCHR
jgi:hypothetical protein